MQQIVLQNITPRDAALPCPETLWQRGLLDAHVGWFEIKQGDPVHFDGFANLFNFGVWTEIGDFEAVSLMLKGSGTVLVDVLEQSHAKERPQSIVTREVTLTDHGVDIPVAPSNQQSILTLRLQSLSDTARIFQASWLGRSAVDNATKLAIIVTTYAREAQAYDAIKRIADFLLKQECPLSQAHLFIVDNGQSLSLPQHQKYTLIPSQNLGGSGGFARGLFEARQAGFSHCLFMDDDAAAPLENVTRIAAAFRLGRDPKLAISGSMIAREQPDQIWENGAKFNRMCQAEAHGLCLTSPEELSEFEFARMTPRITKSHYGGWWCFAFPIAALRHDPFPFFLRGDDSAFCLSNDFTLRSLPGVFSVQDGFGAKETPLTRYLDLRYHLSHHLMHRKLGIGAFGSACVALRLIMHSMMRMHYHNAHAELAAWRSLFAGERSFPPALDITALKRDLAQNARHEDWGFRAEQPDWSTRSKPPKRVTKLLFKFSLNGHLLPFFKSLGRRVHIPIEQRGAVWPLWGAAMACHTRPDGQSYIVAHSKLAFFKIAVQALVLTIRWVWAYSRLKAEFRKAFCEMTTREFWQAQFSIGALPAK